MTDEFNIGDLVKINKIDINRDNINAKNEIIKEEEAMPLNAYLKNKLPILKNKLKDFYTQEALQYALKKLNGNKPNLKNSEILEFIEREIKRYNLQNNKKTTNNNNGSIESKVEKSYIGKKFSEIKNNKGNDEIKYSKDLLTYIVTNLNSKATGYLKDKKYFNKAVEFLKDQKIANKEEALVLFKGYIDSLVEIDNKQEPVKYKPENPKYKSDIRDIGKKERKKIKSFKETILEQIRKESELLQRANALIKSYEKPKIMSQDEIDQIRIDIIKSYGK